MLPTAIVPVRSGPFSKRRLAHRLSAADRVALVERLFAHVCGILVEAGLRVLVTSPHPVQAPSGVEVLTDRGRELNGAAREALAMTGTPALIVHADLPHLNAQDVWAMVDVPGDIVIARARDGGTNALLLRAELRPCFGPNSALVHAQRARAAGLRTVVLDRPGLALDVDDDAALTASSSRPTSSYRPPLP